MTADREKAARELLAFYLEAGVDAPVGETPVDRFADPPPPAPAAVPPRRCAHPDGSASAAAAAAAHRLGSRSRPAAAATRPPPRRTPPSWRRATRRARPPASTTCAPSSSRFEGCALRSTATQLGVRRRQPAGARDVRRRGAGPRGGHRGLPFVGRSGKLLDRMLAAIGLDETFRLHRQHRAVAAARQPHADAAGIRDLPAVHPAPDRARRSRRAGLPRRAVGADAARHPGRHPQDARPLVPFHTGTREIRAIATFHPAYLLRSPLQKRLAWRDFLAIKKALAN